MEKKSKDILKAIDAGQSCEQILAGDSAVTYHDIFHALTEAPTTYWKRTPGRGAGGDGVVVVRRIVGDYRPIEQMRLVQFAGNAWQPIGDVVESAFLKAALGQELTKQLTPCFFTNHQGQELKKHLPLCG